MAGRVLLCLDGSSFANAAASVALQLLAKSTDGTTLIVLHVVNVTRASGNVLKDIKGRLGFEPAVVNESVVRAHEEQGQMVLDAFKRDAEIAGIQVESVLEHGAVTERIEHHANLCDLVIMGVRGETEDRFPGQGGGHLEGIVRDVTVPTIFVTRESRQITGIVVGYDGSEGAAHALRKTEPLAQMLGMPLDIVYISKDGSGQDILDEAAASITLVPVKTYIAPKLDGLRSESLVRFALTHDANLLAIGRLGQSALRDFLYGGVVDEVLLRTPLMMLIVR